jgi:hypothetical protein
MRFKLAQYKGQRRRFEGTFERFGIKSGYKGPLRTLVLLKVVDVLTREEVCDHLWFTVGKQLDRLDLKEGDIIRFDARVTRYLKGYVHRDEDNREVDYRLSFPNKFVKMNQVNPNGIGVSERAQTHMSLNCRNDETPSHNKEVEL